MNPRRIALTLPLILLICMSFKCDSGGTTASATARLQHSYERALNDTAGVINTMVGLKRKLAQQGKLTAAEDSRLTEQLLKINTAAKAVRSEGPLASSIPALKSSIDELSPAIVTIQASDSKAELQRTLQSLEASAAALANVSAMAASRCHDVGGGCIVCRGDPCTYCPFMAPSCP